MNLPESVKIFMGNSLVIVKLHDMTNKLQMKKCSSINFNQFTAKDLTEATLITDQRVENPAVKPH